MPSNRQKIFDRNSSGMNHSQNNFLAVIDIHRALSPMQAAQIKMIDRSMPKLNVRKIMGSPVVSIISQNILAIGPAKRKPNN